MQITWNKNSEPLRWAKLQSFSKRTHTCRFAVRPIKGWYLCPTKNHRHNTASSPFMVNKKNTKCYFLLPKWVKIIRHVQDLRIHMSILLTNELAVQNTRKFVMVWQPAFDPGLWDHRELILPLPQVSSVYSDTLFSNINMYKSHFSFLVKHRLWFHQSGVILKQCLFFNKMPADLNATSGPWTTQAQRSRISPTCVPLVWRNGTISPLICAAPSFS